MKQKIELEYSIKSSPRILFTRLSTPGGLAEWFADDVNLRGSVFSFIWEGSEQKANLVQKKENSHIRFSWIDDEDDTYFEFRISVDELTKDVALVVTDFVEEDEKEDTIELWNTQISELKHTIGL
jgi:uncharacterized protein YndB with AHSA1/START domain